MRPRSFPLLMFVSPSFSGVLLPFLCHLLVLPIFDLISSFRPAEDALPAIPGRSQPAGHSGDGGNPAVHEPAADRATPARWGGNDDVLQGAYRHVSLEVADDISCGLEKTKNISMLQKSCERPISKPDKSKMSPTVSRPLSTLLSKIYPLSRLLSPSFKSYRHKQES